MIYLIFDFTINLLSFLLVEFQQVEMIIVAFTLYVNSIFHGYA